MKHLLALLIVLFFSGSLVAQERSFIKSPRFWMASGVVASAVLDIETSQKVFSQGGFETNPLFGYGTRPSRAHMYGVVLPLDAARYGLAMVLGHGLKKAGHSRLGWLPEGAMSGYLIEEHVRGAAGNIRAIR